MKGNKFQIPLHTSKAKDGKMSQSKIKLEKRPSPSSVQASSNQNVSPDPVNWLPVWKEGTRICKSETNYESVMGLV